MKFGTFGGGVSATPPIGTVRINHDIGAFEVEGKALGKEIRGIMLGLVRQRQLWRDRKLSCESADFENGLAFAERFPFTVAGFDQFKNTTGTVQLPCKDCELRKWSHGQAPLCTEQWVTPIVLGDSVDIMENLVENARVHFIVFTRSSIDALRKYLTPFRDKQVPVYTVSTRITLTRVEKNGKRFASANFIQRERITERAWPKLSDKLREARTERTKAASVPTSDFTSVPMGGLAKGQPLPPDVNIDPVSGQSANINIVSMPQRVPSPPKWKHMRP